MGFVLAGLDAIIFVILMWNVCIKCFFLLIFVSLWAFFLVWIRLALGLDKSQLQLIHLIVPFFDLTLKQDYLAIESLYLS